MKLPDSWSKMTLNDKTRVDQLRPGDRDYVRVLGYFTSESGILAANVVKVVIFMFPDQKVRAKLLSPVNEVWGM